MSAQEFCETEFSGESKGLCNRYPAFFRELGMVVLDIINNAAIDDITTLTQLVEKSLAYAGDMLKAEQEHAMLQKNNA